LKTRDEPKTTRAGGANGQEEDAFLASLPASPEELLAWDVARFEPLYQELLARPLTGQDEERWLRDWSVLSSCVEELGNRIYVATTVDTSDERAQQRHHEFMETLFPKAQQWEQALRGKALQADLHVAGMELPLLKMRTQSALFREENLALIAREQDLVNHYNQLVSRQTVDWEGEEVTVSQLDPVLQETDRARRERAWLLASQRQLEDRSAINDLWSELFPLRLQSAKNAGFSDYRSFRWQELLRFDYTPEDALRFHEAIREVVVPAAERIYERRRRQLGVGALRPWDLEVDPLGRPPLHPFDSVEDLLAKAGAIFERLDGDLGAYFQQMRAEGLLDVANRKNKAPGGYTVTFAHERKPFVFTNAVGVHDDVQTVFHESGHAFHVFESAALPYYFQRDVPTEFAEVASMGMELLTSPYLAREQGGFYTRAEAARARLWHLEGLITFWPYMAVVDGLQHWAYTHPKEGADPDHLDATWRRLWAAYMAGVSWEGLEDALVTGWQRKLHILTIPFYYIEYGFAQLGAVQLWHAAREDEHAEIGRYRQALALGGTRSLPELYQAAGARLSFDPQDLQQAVGWIEAEMERLRVEAQEDSLD
jgi:oligoendopeptidase F